MGFRLSLKRNIIVSLIFICLLFVSIQKNNYLFNKGQIIEYCKDNNETDERMNIKIYAIISTTLDDNYTFNLPVVIQAWRKLNIEPIVLVITDDYKFIFKENSSSSQILQYLDRLNVKTLHIKANSDFSIVISQVIRLFIGIFPNDIIKDDDFVITTDSDLVPLKSSYYNVDMNRVEKTITIWNAYCCGHFKHIDKQTYRMFPVGNIGMTKKNWRHVIQLNEMNYKLDGDSVLKFLLSIYGNGFVQEEGKGKLSWYADQRLISVFVHKYVTSNNNVKLDLRSYCGIRLDRTTNEIEWNVKLEKSELLTDAHLFQYQSDLHIGLFEDFLLKCFHTEPILINFYQKLISKFWTF